MFEHLTIYRSATTVYLQYFDGRRWRTWEGFSFERAYREMMWDVERMVRGSN